MNKSFDIRLGEVMRKHREAKHLSTTQVGELLNVSKVSVHYWETGKRQINASMLKKYCDVVGVRVQALFDEMDGIV
jgi:transcriptional regulator with XRE-family HTH domain